MAIRHQRPRWFASCLLIVVLASSGRAAAQENGPSIFLHAVKTTIFDPTTYAPAIIGYDATMRDWKTSQTFFENGFVEHNARFTVTGLPDGTAVSYADGKNQILKDAVGVFMLSAAQNLSSRLIESALLERYPEHRKLVRTLGWIERVSFGAALSYGVAAPHYRQWQQNMRLAAQLNLP